MRSQGSADSVKVLLIEDEKVYVTLLRHMLAECNFEVVRRKTLKTGLKSLRKGCFDLVLLDLNLPDSLGEETFEKLTRAFPEIPVVVLTHIEDEQTAIKLISRGGQDYLVKNRFDREYLERVLRFSLTRKQVETALRESERRKSTILETALDAIVTIDDAGKVVEFNPSAERIFGYSAEEARGRDVAGLIVPPGLRRKHRKGFKRHLETGHGNILGRRIELSAMRSGGEEFPIELTIAPIQTEGRRSFTAFIRDISERKQAEEALKKAHEELEQRVEERTRALFEEITERKQAEETIQESNERFRVITETSPIAILISEISDGRILFCNGQLGELYGIPAEELVGRNVVEFFHDPGERPDMMETLRREGRVNNYERRIKRKDGTEGWALISSQTMELAGKRVLLSALMDISERKRTEYDLQEKTGLVELMHRVAVAANEATTLKEAIQTTLKDICVFTGWPIGHVYAVFPDSPDGLIPTNIWYIDDPKRFADFKKITEETEFETGVGLPGRVLASKRPEWIVDVAEDPNFPRFNMVRDFGARTGFGVPVLVGKEVIAVIEFFTAQVIDPDQSLLRAVEHIGTQLGRVAERERAGENLRASMVQVEAASRAKSEFLANMSHELRTPLNAIIGFSETMRREMFGPLGNDKYKEYLDNIHDSGGGLLSIINDILDISAIEAGKLELREEKVDVAEAVEASLRIVGPRAAERQVRLSSAVGKDLPALRADGGRFRQILLNLLSNAVKFTDEGGEVKIEARLGEAGSVLLTVADDGIGMSEGDVSKALSPFSQIDGGLGRRHEGSGLGLPLAKSFVEMHGGNLEVRSAPGTGTTVIVRIPSERVWNGAGRKTGK